MTIFTGTNEGRVNKIVEITKLLQKSFTSNNPTSDEIRQLMAPALDVVTSLVEAEAPTPEPIKQRHDIMLWKEAQTAPLSELMLAYTTITSRLADLVDENQT